MTKRRTVVGATLGATAVLLVLVTVFLHSQRFGSSTSQPDVPAADATKPGLAAGSSPQPGTTPTPGGGAPPREAHSHVPAAISVGRESPNEPASGQTALAPVFLAGDFPLYLSVAAQSTPGRSPQGCKSLYSLLRDMAEETRDEYWAERVERELRELVERHPNGFHVSVGCRATICQVSVVGDHGALARDSGAADTVFWHRFRQGLRRSATGAELGINGFFGGMFPTDPPQHIAGMVLTSVGYDRVDEPPGCTSFGSQGDADDS